LVAGSEDDEVAAGVVTVLLDTVAAVDISESPYLIPSVDVSQYNLLAHKADAALVTVDATAAPQAWMAQSRIPKPKSATLQRQTTLFAAQPPRLSPMRLLIQVCCAGQLFCPRISTG
jgi:hypothetical protein